jgi:ketosteroid isomerase-like protein
VKTAQHRARGAFAQAGLVALACACAGPPLAVDASDRAAIERVLHEQDLAWNRGDLHAFVAGYAEGERMTYVGKGGTLVRGRAALEERYRRSYPEGRRGTLTFSDLDFRRVGPDDYLVLGRWALDLPPENPHGVFTLVFERGPDGLAIIHDHSSGAD